MLVGISCEVALLPRLQSIMSPPTRSVIGPEIIPLGLDVTENSSRGTPVSNSSALIASSEFSCVFQNFCLFFSSPTGTKCSVVHTPNSTFHFFVKQPPDSVCHD